MKMIYLLLCLLCGLALSSCVFKVDPGHPESGQSVSEYYRNGYSAGESDARRSRTNNASRHFDAVPRSYRGEFASGYNRGYDSRRPRGSGSVNYYQEGSSAGQRDRIHGLSYQPQRHHDSIPPSALDSFNRGYAASWGSTSVGPPPGYVIPPQFRR